MLVIPSVIKFGLQEKKKKKKKEKGGGQLAVSSLYLHRSGGGGKKMGKGGKENASSPAPLSLPLLTPAARARFPIA